MNKLLLAGAAALAVCIGVATTPAEATVINYDLAGAGQNIQSSYTNQGVTFTGWERNSYTHSIDQANLYFKNESSYERGLGLVCNPGAGYGSKCSQHEIGSSPAQAIDINISSLLAMPGFTQLTIGVGSVDSNGGGYQSESALIWGSSATAQAGRGSFTFLDQYKYGYNGNSKVSTFTFTAAQLAAYDYLHVTDGGGYFGNGSSGCLGNVLLSSVSATVNQVPEPSGSGMFDFGLLAIGALAGLRRRSKS